MLQEILNLQAEIFKSATTDFDTGDTLPFYIEYSPYISFSQVGSLFALTFFGEGFDENPQTKAVDFQHETNFAFCRFLDFITEPAHAEKIISLKFQGADAGANGTKSWNFNRLANANVLFPNLKYFEVQLTDLGDHNQSILDDFSYEENGITAKLLQKMPNLESLILPSAPNKSFFEIETHPLKHLKIQAGYNHENFIENWSNSRNFPNLTTVDYSEIIDIFEVETDEYTKFESFKKLFKSEAFSSVKHFTLWHFNLSNEQLFELQRLSSVQFSIIDAHGRKYVNHLMK
ncbi:MAG: hypothetical protein Q4A00_00730 [Flavobacteriaceae bacterium]|nr:hypothetical protein [Flavobacteriaceae bacterium]